jgi:GNAT superfamily N-acetyltransferase
LADLNTVSLRLAEPGDAAAIADVFFASRDDALSYLPKIHSDAEVRAWIYDKLLPSAETWVAELDGRIVGFAAIRGQELDQLYIEPGFYRRGIGSLLVAKAKERRPGGLWLYTFARNARARAFYESHGFVVIGSSDGSDNEEREPDLRYEWTPPATPAAAGLPAAD